MNKKTTFSVSILAFLFAILFGSCKKTDDNQSFLQEQKKRNKAEIEAYIAQSGKSFIQPANSEGFYYNLEANTPTSGAKADTASFTDVYIKYRVRILPSLDVVDDDYANKVLNFTLDCNPPILGVNVAAKLIFKGSKGTFLFDNEGAYGAGGSPFIPAYSAVVVDLEIVDLKTEQDLIDAYITSKGYTNVVQTVEGVKYARTGLPTTPISDTVKSNRKLSVDYVGKLVKKPETSFDQGTNFTLGSVNLGTASVIKGWKLGLVDRQVGEKGVLLIPSKYAYGKTGSGTSIPCYAPLIFEMTIKSVTK